MSCYLDNAATTKLAPEMKEYLISALDIFGNPSSAHSEGAKSNVLIESVRQKVQKFINAESSDEIYFTSSGSASNALGIQGFALNGKCNIIYSPTAHKSILKTIDNLAKFDGANTIALRVNSCGEVDIAYIEKIFRRLILKNG